MYTPRWCHPGHIKNRQKHRSHLPDHSNARPRTHAQFSRHRGLARRWRSRWAVLGCTLVACAYPVVMVQGYRPTPETGIVHTSRTIQTRTLAGTGDGAVIEVSRAPRGVFGLSRALQSLHVHTRWCWYRNNVENPCPSSFTPLPDHSFIQRRAQLGRHRRWCSH